MSQQDALKAEANTETVNKFTYKNKTFTVPHPDEWPLDVLEAYESNKVLTAVRAILGEEQYQKFKKDNPKSKDLQEFTNKMMEAVGADSGE